MIQFDVRALGTAVWLYCIMVNYNSFPAPLMTNVSFELDGAPAGTYIHIPDQNDTQFVYNVNVFSQTDLENAEHTLVMTAIQGAQPSYLLFDWAKYTLVQCRSDVCVVLTRTRSFDDGEASSNTTSTTTSRSSVATRTSSDNAGATPTHRSEFS